MHRQTSEELGEESVFDEVLGIDLTRRRRFVAKESDRFRVARLFHVGERAGADKEDVRDIDLDIVVLVPVRGDVERNENLFAFENLEQRLLHAFSADVARSGAGACAAAATCDLVDLVDKDDPVFGRVDVLIRRIEQTSDRHLDILAVVARLGERGGVVVRERHVENARERPRQIGLARAGRADHEDVRLADGDFAAEFQVLDALEMIVRGDREHLLRMLLPHHVLIELLKNAPWSDVKKAVDVALFFHSRRD